MVESEALISNPSHLSQQAIDRRLAWAAALTLFGLFAGHTILEIARDALFLARLPAEQLPATYLMIAVGATIAAQIDSRLLRHLDDRRVLAVTLALGAVGALVFRRLFATEAAWVPHAFYVWTGSIATVAVAQFWRLNSEIFTVASAKRFFAPIGAGGALGAIAGAGLAELAQHWVGPRDLLMVGAIVFVVSAFVPPLLLPAPEPRPARRTIAPERLADIRSSTRSHLRLLLAAVALTAITATLVDYAFKSAIGHDVAPDQLGTFFSRFYFGLNVLSLIVQVALAPYLLRTLGVTRALLVLPATLALGATGALLLGGVVAAVVLRAADGGLRQSLHRSAIELLYFPLSTRQRKHYKGSVEALGQRLGQAVGSVVIVVATIAGIGLREFSVIVIVIAAGWTVLAMALRRSYLDLFRDNLHAGVIETSPNIASLDVASLESLIASLNSERDEEVLSTLGILVDQSLSRLVPALLLFHPSRAVVLRTLEILGESGRTDHLAVARRLLDNPDGEIRAAAMRLVASSFTPDELRRALAVEPRGAARDAVLVELVASGLDNDGGARRAIHERVLAGTPEERVALARAIRFRGGTTFLATLHALAARADGEVRREVARAFGALRDESAVGTLVHWLGPRGARADARAALVALGPAALAALATSLADVSLPREVRAHLPRTIARFANATAAEVLFDQLEPEADGWIRYKILRALRSLRDVLPQHRFDSERLARSTRRTLLRACDVLGSRLELRAAQERAPSKTSASGALLEPILAEKEAQAIDRAVRMIALDHPREVLNGIVHAVRSPDRRLRAESRELLSNVAKPVLGMALATLLDDEATDEDRLARARSALGEPEAKTSRSHTALLAELLGDDSEGVRCIAAYHVAELRLTDLEGPLREARARATSLSRDVITHALETLEHVGEVRSA